MGGTKNYKHGQSPVLTGVHCIVQERTSGCFLFKEPRVFELGCNSQVVGYEESGPRKGPPKFAKSRLTPMLASLMKELPRGFPSFRLAEGIYRMHPTRRDFLKLTTIGGAAAAVFGFDLKPAYAQLRTLKIARASETRSTCPYCAVGCGTIIYTIGDRAKNVTAQVVHVEGDPDHPTNRGTLCPKGASLQQEILNDRRLVKPLVRRPGGTDWEDISWDQAINEIAAKVKKTRDDTFIERDAAGHTVNRLESVAWIGGCTDTNEFNYLVVKSMRALGVVHLENQARV